MFSLRRFVLGVFLRNLWGSHVPELSSTDDIRMAGRANGTLTRFRAPLRARAPLGRFLQYGYRTLAVSRSVDVGDLNPVLLTKVNYSGSDIRVATGDILNPRAFPRQGLEASWWNWTPVFKCRWGLEEHINALEVRSIFLARLKFHVFRRCASDVRIFHATDSFVCVSVISKGRSGSCKLNHILQQLNAILLGFNISLIIGHVESTQNPTDDASRA